MKYAITGHTSGIGKRLFDKLSPNAIGFSRSNGYNITIEENRRTIIEQSADCDIFINNAYSGFGQTQLLLDIFKAWRNTNKTIINIGSKITERSLDDSRLELLNYQAEKIILKEMCNRLQNKGSCEIKYKSFGYVGTAKILEKYPHFTQVDYISEDIAVSVILN